MKVDSSRLWTRLKEKGIKNKTDLIQMARTSTNILAKVNKGEYISMVVFIKYARLWTVILRILQLLKKAETEFEKYRIVQDRLYKSDFDLFLEELENKLEANKHGKEY